MSLLREVARETSQLLVKEPFYGHFFVHVLKVEHPDTFGLAIGPSEHVILRVCRPVWAHLTTREQRQGAIKHQILHLLFKHPFVAHRFGDRQLFGLAADLAVDPFLTADQRAPGALLPEDFGLPDNLGVQAYYRLLAGTGDSVHAAMDRGFDHHGGWPDFARLSDGSRSIVEGELNRNLHRAARRTEKSRGHLPGKVTESLRAVALALRPAVHWKKVLRIFASSGRKTRVRPTTRRPSKRYGTTPGIRIQRYQRLLVVLDTSGSIGDGELGAFFAEVDRIRHQGAEVVIAECDAEVQRHYPYAGRPPEGVRGRGGTDFDPAIELANTLAPDAVIYFTDGRAPVPKVACRKPLLWLITPDGISAGDAAKLPGRVVHMQPIRAR